MNPEPLTRVYQGYLDCLNRQDWANLGRFVAGDVRHNDRALGLSGYRQMLEDDFRAIPDLAFHADRLAVTPPVLACRLVFDCTPTDGRFGSATKGQRVRFAEHVFYHFASDHIAEVWSIIDQAAIVRPLTDRHAA